MAGLAFLLCILLMDSALPLMLHRLRASSYNMLPSVIVALRVSLLMVRLSIDANKRNSRQHVQYRGSIAWVSAAR